MQLRFPFSSQCYTTVSCLDRQCPDPDAVAEKDEGRLPKVNYIAVRW